MSVITFYSVFLNLSAFINPVSSLPLLSPIRTFIHPLLLPFFLVAKRKMLLQFFIAPWQTANGWTWTFAAQGILTFFLSVPSIALLHRFGPMLRNQSGQMGWVNPEYDTL